MDSRTNSTARFLSRLIDDYYGTSNNNEPASLYSSQFNYNQPNLEVSDQVKKALEDAHNTKPRVINIINHPSNMNICVLGCAGSLNEGPLDVARYINATVEKNPELKPDLFIILGDNFYPDGVSRPDDPRFELNFHGIYGHPELEFIKDVPCLVILGNHDLKYDTESQIKSYVPYNNYILGTNPLTSEEAGLQQVAHSLMAHESDHPELAGESKADFFQQPNIDYALQPKHNMPHSFYSYVFDKLQIFCLNSNTYLRDFLIYLENFANDKSTPADNQAVWLQEEYNKAIKAGRTTLFAMHHPLFSVGKRPYKSGWDAKHYLNPIEITLWSEIRQLNPKDTYFKTKLKKIFDNAPQLLIKKNANYNEMLTQAIYDFQDITPHLTCTAHDHSIYYYNNKLDKTAKNKICQMVAGAGGSDELQSRLYFGNHDNLGTFIKKHGFALLSCDTKKPELFDINVFSVDGLHLKFTSNDPLPIRPGNNTNDIGDKKVEEIREIILSACDNYQKFLHAKQTTTKGGFFNYTPALFSGLSGLQNYNTSHTLSDVECMHDMLNYINQATPPTYEDTIIFLFKAMNDIYNKSSIHSLYTDINTMLLEKFNKTIDFLMEEIIPLKKLDEDDFSSTTFYY